MAVGSAQLVKLDEELTGEILFDESIKTIYSTDASVYKEIPLAVAFPSDEDDIVKLIEFANNNSTSLIPRTAGTSLAGQVVGQGIVVDVSRSFSNILGFNKEERWIKVQPAVVRDELNLYLKPHYLLFGPITATANRAMIGGMVANNSCGQNSLRFGSTRDHLLEVTGFLSDGSKVTFGEVSVEEFQQKMNSDSLEDDIYRKLNEILSSEENQEMIKQEFPKLEIKRRNTGYALDIVSRMSPFVENGEKLNLAKLIAGSEGTLFFITEIKLSLEPLSPAHRKLLCAHFESISDSLQANIIAAKYKPFAAELFDHYVLERTKTNITYCKNRFFVKDDPKAILAVELDAESEVELDSQIEDLIDDFKSAGLGYHFPVVDDGDITKVWALRKAGLGLLSNIPGDSKPVAVIEDTCVSIHDLPEYIREFNVILDKHNLPCVHYAHVGSGELHLRPILNLKTKEGHELFRIIADEIAVLVNKYRGSLSGEHGDGRLRGEYIQLMLGEKVFGLLVDVKKAFDPDNIFNPGKIVDTPKMDESLRFESGTDTPEIETYFDFSKEMGFLRAVEFCNGSGDCRKSEKIGGTMCPSYMATKDERYTTRARANVMREYLRKPFAKNNFEHKEIVEILDNCLSCKGCKSECPSNVDMSKLKAEYLQHYYDLNGTPLRSLLVANFTTLSKIGSIAPGLFNFVNDLKITRKLAGFTTKRSFPKLQKETTEKWFKKNCADMKSRKKVFLFVDEFTNYNDSEIGILAIKLLRKLGYDVILPSHVESGRAALSKGLLKKGRKVAVKNVKMLADIVSEDTPLIGIEPSAVLSFRDEYPNLVPDELKEKAVALGKNALLFDEFIACEIENGNIDSSVFTDKEQVIELHGHCFQKSLASLETATQMLSLPKNYTVNLIPSGCCGMAGSFGFEEEHYELSMKIGELVLFPHVRNLDESVIVAASGTSCRQQIKDGTDVTAQHPIEILYNALR